MQMAVDVVERQAGGVEFFKLRVDFGAKLFAQAALEKIIHADADGRVAEFAARINEAGDFLRRQRGMAHAAKSDAGRRRVLDFPSRVRRPRRSRFVHHQAGGRQNAVAMRADDGFVHRRRKAEVVGIDDETARRLQDYHNGPHVRIKSCRRQNRSQDCENQRELLRLAQLIGCAPNTLNFPRSSFCTSRQ